MIGFFTIQQMIMIRKNVKSIFVLAFCSKLHLIILSWTLIVFCETWQLFFQYLRIHAHDKVLWKSSLLKLSSVEISFSDCYNDHDCGYNAECHYGECKCKYGFKEALDHYGVFKCEPIHQYPEEQPSYQQPEPKHCYSTNDCDYGQKCCKKTVYQKTYHGTEISYTYECADYCQHKN